ncbi:MAG: amidinotransferase [Rhodospirillales bacterium]|nr:amidinotransferase [Rhodospirillales bacterium]
MAEDGIAGYRYAMTIKKFGSVPEPAFEDTGEQLATWGQVWGCDSDVGRLRKVLVHRPGNEMAIVDRSKYIPEIDAFGDPEVGWYWQHDSIPDLAEMQAQHDAMTAVLAVKGVEAIHLEDVRSPLIKACYTRDSVIAVKGGAIVSRMAPRVRRGEELCVTRTLGRIGMPILRTITGVGMLEGGSFAWINSRTAVIGRSIRVNDEAIRQLAEVLRGQGVELIVIDLRGYDIHIDGCFVMIDRDLALVDAGGLPFTFLERLKELGVRAIEITPQDNPWIVNCLAVAPGDVLMPQGASNRTLDRLAEAGVTVTQIAYDKMQTNGGSIHCSTGPLLRDPL